MKSKTLDESQTADSVKRCPACEANETQPEARQQDQGEPGESARRPRPSVVLAEDDDELRRLIAGRLRKDGYEVTECRDGAELLNCLDYVFNPESSREPKGRHVDLVVSDIRMPGVFGMTVLQGAQEFSDFPPTILITAFGDKETHKTAKQRGAVAVLDKPFEMDDLLSKVHEVVPLGSD